VGWGVWGIRGGLGGPPGPRIWRKTGFPPASRMGVLLRPPVFAPRRPAGGSPPDPGGSAPRIRGPGSAGAPPHLLKKPAPPAFWPIPDGFCPFLGVSGSISHGKKGSSGPLFPMEIDPSTPKNGQNPSGLARRYGGGYAHPPDPSGQSALPVDAERRARAPPGPPTQPQRGPSGPPLGPPKPKKRASSLFCPTAFSGVPRDPEFRGAGPPPRGIPRPGGPRKTLPSRSALPSADRLGFRWVFPSSASGVLQAP